MRTECIECAWLRNMRTAWDTRRRAYYTGDCEAGRKVSHVGFCDKRTPPLKDYGDGARN